MMPNKYPISRQTKYESEQTRVRVRCETLITCAFNLNIIIRTRRSDIYGKEFFSSIMLPVINKLSVRLFKQVIIDVQCMRMLYLHTFNIVI